MQELLWIDRIAVDAGLIVQVRAGGAAGRTDLADHLADLDALSDLHVDLGEMAVAGREAIAMIDLDHAAVTTAPASFGHRPGGGCVYRIATVAAEVDPSVHRGLADEWI